MLLFAHLGIALAAGRFAARAVRVDLAFLALGAILPDIIDKPLGDLIYGTPNMGRIYAHTILFLLILTAAAFYTRDIRLYSLAAGVMIHLGLDFMWNSPIILFWPLLGGFPMAAHLDSISYLQMLLLGLRRPLVMIPEILGLAYLIFLGWEKRLVLTAQARQYAIRIRKGATELPHYLLKGSE